MPFTFKTSFRVSWTEPDASQIVHFSNYFRFFERTEEELYRHLGFNYNDVVKKHNILLPRVGRSVNSRNLQGLTTYSKWRCV